MSDNNEIKLNILILGQTGVGKSSLLNALIGEKIQKTGSGKPVTERGIFPFEAIISNKKVIIHDSWGLEAGKDQEWENILNDSLKEHGIDKGIRDWYHSVTYCIQAGGGRIQDFDIKIIKKFISEKYNTIVAVTKIDQIYDENEKQKFINTIKEKTGAKNIIAISADPQQTRFMDKKPEMQGIEEYKKSILISWRQIFLDRIPPYIISKIKNDIYKKRAEYISKKLKDFNEKDTNKLSKNIKEDFEIFIEEGTNYYIIDNIKNYYTVSLDIININKNLNINLDSNLCKINNPNIIQELMNMYENKNFDIKILAKPLFLGLGGFIFEIASFNKDKKKAIDEYIDNISNYCIDQVSSIEFENKIKIYIKNCLERIENY